jgi:hypothetical protein
VWSVECRHGRTPSPTARAESGQGHLQAQYVENDDVERLASPLVRCAAAFGPQPLSVQDVDIIRKLVSRMATFAAYRACMPGGLEAVEDTERWQRSVWTAEAEEHAAYLRRKPAWSRKQQPRGCGQGNEQLSNSKASWERPSSNRIKSGSMVSQLGSSKSSTVSPARGIGGDSGMGTEAAPEQGVVEPVQNGAAVNEHPAHKSSCSLRPESSKQEGLILSQLLSDISYTDFCNT